MDCFTFISWLCGLPLHCVDILRRPLLGNLYLRLCLLCVSHSSDMPIERFSVKTWGANLMTSFESLYDFNSSAKLLTISFQYRIVGWYRHFMICQRRFNTWWWACGWKSEDLRGRYAVGLSDFSNSFSTILFQLYVSSILDEYIYAVGQSAWGRIELHSET